MTGNRPDFFNDSTGIFEAPLDGIYNRQGITVKSPGETIKQAYQMGLVDDGDTWLDAYPEIEKVVIFGSRANGNFERGSDIDLALFGDLNMSQISHIEHELNEETHIPLFFDVVGYQLLTSTSLKEHIISAGQEL